MGGPLQRQEVAGRSPGSQRAELWGMCQEVKEKGRNSLQSAGVAVSAWLKAGVGSAAGRRPPETLGPL